MIDFGTYLRKLRKENKTPLRELAVYLGVGVPFMSLIETGKKKVPLEYGDKLAEYFHLSEQQTNELKNAIDYTNQKVSINLEDLSQEQQELSIAFARTINTASQKKLEELRKLLESDD